MCESKAKESSSAFENTVAGSVGFVLSHSWLEQKFYRALLLIWAPSPHFVLKTLDGRSFSDKCPKAIPFSLPTYFDLLGAWLTCALLSFVSKAGNI